MTAAPGLEDRALIVVDVQQGFADSAWGTRNNPMPRPTSSG
jgi:nicotinamidase-related amidase